MATKQAPKKTVQKPSATIRKVSEKNEKFKEEVADKRSATQRFNDAQELKRKAKEEERLRSKETISSIPNKSNTPVKPAVTKQNTISALKPQPNTGGESISPKGEESAPQSTKKVTISILGEVILMLTNAGLYHYWQRKNMYLPVHEKQSWVEFQSQINIDEPVVIPMLEFLNIFGQHADENAVLFDPEIHFDIFEISDY